MFPGFRLYEVRAHIDIPYSHERHVFAKLKFRTLKESIQPKCICIAIDLVRYRNFLEKQVNRKSFREAKGNGVGGIFKPVLSKFLMS